MKRLKKFLIGNIKTILAFIMGVVVSGGIVYAATIASSSVSYSNTTSGATSTNVQGALDELYTRANTWINPNSNFGTPQYYAFGEYKGWCSYADTNCNSYPDFPTTSTSAPSGKNVYAAKYADGGYGVCIKRNGTPHCFRGRNYAYESQHILKVFSGANDDCGVYLSDVYCNASDFYCVVDSDGDVSCSDNWGPADCYVSSNGDVICSEGGL